MIIVMIMLQGVMNLEEAKANVLGGEVALWTEQADAFSMMSRSLMILIVEEDDDYVDDDQ